MVPSPLSIAVFVWRLKSYPDDGPCLFIQASTKARNKPGVITACTPRPPSSWTGQATAQCRRHSTRGTGPKSSTRKQPKSWCRQLRPPPPLSYLGAFRPQREQRNAPFPHLTRATRTGASRSGESSNDTSSTTMSLTFSNRLNTLFNQGAFLGCILGRKTNLQETPLTPSHSTTQRRATTHENNTRATKIRSYHISTSLIL